jgi:hypothetical protein
MELANFLGKNKDFDVKSEWPHSKLHHAIPQGKITKIYILNGKKIKK